MTKATNQASRVNTGITAFPLGLKKDEHTQLRQEKTNNFTSCSLNFSAILIIFIKFEAKTEPGRR